MSDPELVHDRTLFPPTAKPDELSPLARRLIAPTVAPATRREAHVAIVSRPESPEHLEATPKAIGRPETLETILLRITTAVTSLAARGSCRQRPARKIVGGARHVEIRNDASGPPRREPCSMDDRPDAVVADGDADEGSGFTIEAVHTPGHALNLTPCFALRHEKAMLCGDHCLVDHDRRAALTAL